MKMLVSTKIAIGFAVLVCGGYYGYKTVTDRMILHEKFQPIAPGRINIVGIDPGSGFKIVVSNQTAQLAESSDRLKNGEIAPGEDTGSDDSEAKARIPLRDMLRSMQGDTKALGSFVMSLNDMKEDDLPPERVTWTAEDLRKALDGDKVLQTKLAHDLNVQLDGTPVDELSLRALSDGIVIDAPVSVAVMIGAERKTLIGRVQKPFKSALMRSVERDLLVASVDNFRQEAAGKYGEAALAVRRDPRLKEDVRKALEATISHDTLQALAVYPEKVLSYAQVVVNDSFIQKADMDSYTTNGNVRMCDLNIDLSDEGRRRLWQYSKLRPDTQLLVISDGIAIAAPRIGRELAQSRLTVTQIPDEELVKEAVKTINESKTKATSRQ